MWQHWVPKFYLEGFTDPDIPSGHAGPFTPFLHVYCKSSRTWDRRAPKNVAAEENYYAVRDEAGKLSQGLEQALAQQEDQAAKVLREKVCMRQPLDSTEIGILTSFIGLLAVRVPAHQGTVEMALQRGVRLFSELLHERAVRDPTFFEKVKQDARRAGEKIPDSFLPEDLDPERYDIKILKEFRLKTAVEQFDIVAKVLALKHWIFYYSRPPHFFITTDRPVAVCNPTRPTGLRDAGVAERASLVAVPLSRTVCLMAGPGSWGLYAKDATEAEVAKINRLSGCQANEFLCAPKQDFPGHKDLIAMLAQRATHHRGSGPTPTETQDTNLRASPPVALLEKCQVYVKSDTRFKRWCRLQQALYRKSRKWHFSGEGGGDGRELGNYLTDEDAKAGRNFLNQAIHRIARCRLRNREPKDGIEEGRLRQNMLTSQALCFNLFLPQLASRRLATTIWRALMPTRVAKVNSVKVEHSPGRGRSDVGTGDHSAFDAFVDYIHCDGNPGCLAIETKYTEPFSARGKEPTQRESDLALSMTKLFKEEGWLLMNPTSAEGESQDGRPKKRFMSTQQLWRTHLLAETMRGKPYRHVTYMVLYAEGDTECAVLLPNYQSVLAHHAKPDDLCGSMTLESFFSKVRPILTGRDAEWLDAFHARYLDWSLVEKALAGWKGRRR
jgi:hypothetical protein